MGLFNQTRFENQELLVTVIVPVYNIEKYLRPCIDSIIKQSYKNLEIILVDDGSTDSSAAICDDYMKIDKRIKVLHQENSGSGSARNNAIKIATGKYVTFVDSDDIIAINEVETLVKNILKSGCVMSSVELKFFSDDGITIEPLITKEVETISNIDAMNAVFGGVPDIRLTVSTVSKLYDLQFIQENKIQYSEKYRFLEDQCFNVDYLKCAKGNVIISHDVLYFARSRQGSQSRSLEYRLDGELLDSQKYVYDKVRRIKEINKDSINNAAAGYVAQLITLYCYGQYFPTRRWSEKSKKYRAEIIDFNCHMNLKGEIIKWLIIKAPVFVLLFIPFFRWYINKTVSNFC